MTDAATPTASKIAMAPATEADAKDVVTLWQACDLTRPWNDPDADFRRATMESNSAVLVGRDGQSIVSFVMVGHDGHRGGVYCVSVHASLRKHCHCSSLLTCD